MKAEEKLLAEINGHGNIDPFSTYLTFFPSNKLEELRSVISLCVHLILRDGEVSPPFSPSFSFLKRGEGVSKQRPSVRFTF